MIETAPSSAPAGALPVASTSVSVPVPPAAVPPNAPAQPEAAPAPAKEAEPEKSDAKQDEQPRGDDGKFKPKQTAEDRKARIQGDIDRLTASKRAAEREVARLQQEAMRLHEELQRQKPDEFDTAGQTRRAVREDRLEQTADAARAAAHAATEARSQMFEAKVDSARERIPDIDEALADFQRLPVTDASADLIAESEKAAEIAYYLAKNPAEAYRIARMPMHLQGAEIARIEARVSQAPAVRKTTSAPPPVPMIGGTASPTSKTPAEMSTEEMSKLLYGSA